MVVADSVGFGNTDGLAQARQYKKDDRPADTAGLQQAGDSVAKMPTGPRSTVLDELDAFQVFNLKPDKDGFLARNYGASGTGPIVPGKAAPGKIVDHVNKPAGG